MTDLIAAARETVLEAETRVRKLMETALSQKRYSEVAQLAPIAESLLSISGVVTNSKGAIEMNRTASPDDSNDQQAGATLPATAVRTGHGYPRFERQGDRLAKIAWSKKDRREYEHRAPADLIFRIAELFARNTKRGTPFLMDDLLPFKTRSGDEIPSYQTYLALAWFRSLGLIEARGKDGYALSVDDLRERAEREWKELPDTFRK